MKPDRTNALILAVLLLFCGGLQAQAAVVEYDLTIAEQQVNITGRPVPAMTINNGIPGPTLRFLEGDTARIRVHNEMDVETSIHWHGMLVPNNMDGVPFVNYPPIGPHTTFTYEFPIRQSGTYWYHSHTALQEQSGVYGSLVIAPKKPRFAPDRDYVVLFSDWSDEDPHAILRTLKRGSEWYAVAKGSGQSIIGAARLGMLGDYFTRELQRMPPMDIADVAYDRFLANGRPEIDLAAKPGETVRLRIIDGSSSTFFHLRYSGGPMTIVAADGQGVEPVEFGPLLIGVAETYDVLVKVPATGSYEFRATAHDGSGSASVWIGAGERHAAPAIPRPDLYHNMMGHLDLGQIFALTPAGSMGMTDRNVAAGRFDRPGMMDMGGMGHGAHGNSLHNDSMDNLDISGITMDGGDIEPGQRNGPQQAIMDHGAHRMDDVAMGPGFTEEVNLSGKRFASNFWPLAADVSASKNLAMDGMDPNRPWPPYDKLRATRSTAMDPARPVREIRLTLDGDMERYVWFINNKPLSERDDILIRRGELVRFIMINRTMMHHPMHLHGHFFRVVNGQGDYSPLKHTVDVAPMSTTVIEFDANEFGDWFFHCHLLYHMESGMARMVHYQGFVPAPGLAAVRPNLYTDAWYFLGTANIMSQMTDGFMMLASTRHILDVDWQWGWERVDDPEWEVTPTWGYYLNRFTTLFIGMDLDGTKDQLDTQKGVAGFRYLLPLNIRFMTWFDTYGEFRFVAGKTFELTPRLMLFGEAEYDTDTLWEGKVGISYLLTRSFSLIGQWHSDYGAGGGLTVRF